MDGKKIKMSEIARRAGVSAAAVSRYVNESGYLSEEKRAAICKAIQELNFEPDERHPSRYPRRKTFGITQPPFSGSSHFFEMSSLFIECAKQAGYHVLVFRPDFLHSSLAEIVASMLKERVCGIFLPSMPYVTLSTQELNYLKECDIPIVLISEFDPHYPLLNNLVLDNATGMRIAVEALVQRGCKSLAYLCPPLDTNKSAAQRAQGFREAVASLALEPTMQMIVEEPFDGPFFAPAGYAAAQTAFKENPAIDGILGWTDSYVAGALWYLYETGRRVPEDVKIICFDDDYAPYLCPPLSCMKLPTEQLCRRAVEMLVCLQDPVERMIPRSIHICPYLVERASSK